MSNQPTPDITRTADLDPIIQHESDPRHPTTQVKVARGAVRHSGAARLDECHLALSQPYPMPQHRILAEEPELVVHPRIRFCIKPSLDVLDLAPVLGDVGLDGKVWVLCGEGAELGEELVAAGECEARGDDWLDERFVGGGEW